MKKIFKWLWYTVLLFIFLTVTAYAILYWNRDTLLRALSDQLNKGINGKFHIEKIDFTLLYHFPNFLITLDNVYLRDENYEKYNTDIFSASKIFVDVKLVSLLERKVVIQSMFVEDANVFIFKTKDGYNNTDILKTTNHSATDTSRSESSTLFDLENIGFRNVSVSFTDSIKNKAFRFKFLDSRQKLAQTDSGFNINSKGSIHFDGLLFNVLAGKFLPNRIVTVDLTIHFNRIANRLMIEPSLLTYKKNEIGITGQFSLEKEGPFHLKFTSADLNPTEAKELLHTKLNKTLGKFKSSSPFLVAIDVTGKSIAGYKPAVDVTFQSKNAGVAYGAFVFSDLDLQGTFTNHRRNDLPHDNNNSQITITHFRGTMEQFPVQGKASFVELQDPIIDLEFTTMVTSKDINAHLDNSRFVVDGGTFTSHVKYQGKLSEYLDPTRTKYAGKLAGNVSARNGSLFYKPKKIRLEKIQLSGTFSEKRFVLDNLTLSVNGSPISVNGSMENFIPFFVQPKNKGFVKLNVTSPHLDLTSFTSKREQQKKTKQQVKNDRKKMTDLLDKVYDKLEFDVRMNVDQMTFRKFKASNFTGRLKLDNDRMEANPIKMDVAKGKMELFFSLGNLFDPISPMKIDAQLMRADIKTLFLHFNNFNQKTIQSDNLEGFISAKVKFNANIDDSYVVLGSTMKGLLDCKIVDGGLKNFEPMENMSNFLFKKRDFSDIQFAELNSNFSIDGTNMDIERMEIQSSVLSLFLEGRYSFTDSTSLSVQIPLSNLRKRHKDFKPQNIGTDVKVGPSVFLHVYRNRDINSKIKIDYDPFKKWRSISKR
jgi:hypothetical protein